MKIAFIHPTNPLSESTGATYSANKIIEGLEDKGHEITVYCVEPLEDKSKARHDIENFLEEDQGYGSSTSQLNREIIEREDEFEEYDLVYSYRLDNLLALGKVAGRLDDTSFVVTLNSYGGICPTHSLMYREHRSIGSYRCIRCVLEAVIDESGNKLKEFFKKAPVSLGRKVLRLNRIRKATKYIENIDRFHAVSEYLKRSYSEAGYPEEKIKVTPSILDEKFLVDHKSGFEQPYRLLYVGYLKKHKGADRLIPIIEELDSVTDKQFTLTVVGDGPLYDKIEKQVKEASLDDKVEMRGLVPNGELPEVYASHDLLVNPVRWEEPWGRVFLESLSAGTPIISSDVENGKALEGVVTSDIDVSEFAVNISRTLEKQRLEELSEEAKKQVKGYMPEKTVERLDKSLKELVEQN